MRYRILVLAAFLLTVAAAPFPRAQTPAPAAASTRLEGDWVRIDPDGAGSFDGLGASVPPARLLPGVSAGRGGRGGRGNRGGAPGGAQPGVPNAEGVPYIVVAQPCGGGGGRGNGGLLVNPDSGGVHFVEHKDEVIFA